MIQALIELARNRLPSNPKNAGEGWLRGKILEEATELREVSDEGSDEFLDELGDVLLFSLMLYLDLSQERRDKLVKFVWMKVLHREAFGKRKDAENAFRIALSESRGGD